jgi:hypothetical protein
LGWTQDHLPSSWREIPAVPASAFKESTLTTFDAQRAEIVFTTSGTTASESGRHFLESSSLALYDSSLLASFDRFVLDGDPKLRLRYMLLVPQRPTSSLGYMMRRVAEERGDGRARTYVDEEGGRLDHAALAADLQAAYDEGVPVCIAGTAFAFVALLDKPQGTAVRTRPLSRIMETGGFKGRTRTVERRELYESLARFFGIAVEHIIAEYGMTELCSQYYDAPGPGRRGNGERAKVGPPWLRVSILGGSGEEVKLGEVGILRHVDLANRGSVVAVETEDLALRLPQGFLLLGRDPGARLRGCSLDVEDLLARRG